MTEMVKTSDVFVPGRYPRHTYNPRDDLALEKQLADYLENGGSILTLVGPTKTGKTVLLRKVIEDPIWVEAQGIIDADTFWGIVGGELGMYVDATESADDSSTATGGGDIGLGVVVKLGGQYASSTGTGTNRTAVRVAGVEARKQLQASGRVLVVEDFHFLSREVQREIVRAVKPLVFNDVRVVFAAISHRVHDVPQAVEDMTGRTEPLPISLWGVDELLVIARRGFAVLSVTDDDDVLARRLADNSFGSPHLMQKLCRDLVKTVNAIEQTASSPTALRAPDDWDAFFAAQVEGYAGQWFERLLNGPKQRGGERTEYVLPGGQQVDGYGMILVALSGTGPEVSIGRERLNAEISALLNGQKLEGHQVTRFLKHMTKIAARNLEEDVLPEEVLDQEEESVYRYTGPEPVFEYVEDGAVATLTIADPFFAYYLRWGALSHIE